MKYRITYFMGGSNFNDSEQAKVVKDIVSFIAY
jgi:hypothetical protein